MTARHVLAALATLPRRRREVLVLRYWLGLNETEIAAALGISRGTVKSTAARGIAALARTIGEAVMTATEERLTDALAAVADSIPRGHAATADRATTAPPSPGGLAGACRGRGRCALVIGLAVLPAAIRRQEQTGARPRRAGSRTPTTLVTSVNDGRTRWSASTPPGR